jgi:hypothetical protein
MATRATTGECRARSLFLPGTPGRGRQAGRLRAALRALSSNGPTRSGIGLREQERARAHGYGPECAKAAQWSGRDRLAQHGCCGDDGQGVGEQGCQRGDGEGSPAVIADLEHGGPKHIARMSVTTNADRAPRAVASFAGDTGGRRWTEGALPGREDHERKGPVAPSQIRAAVVDPPPPSRVPPASDVAGATKPTTTSAAPLADCAGRRSERHGSAAAAPCSRR